mmetsp:Transcript_34717/g.97413  ORF Transcript_34717/g.97413 Transcript_34717/m.97413 type:complete len:252 (+) Transcript_34717:338-1093(+)
MSSQPTMTSKSASSPPGPASAPQRSSTARARPPQAASFRSTFRSSNGSVPARSVSTTSEAPRAAATRPTKPAPAPSSTTRLPLTISGCAMRCVARAREAGQTKKPVASSPVGFQVVPPCSLGSCSKASRMGNAGCSKWTTCSFQSGPLNKILSSCCSVNLSGVSLDTPKEKPRRATSRRPSPPRRTRRRSSMPSRSASRRSSSTRLEERKDTDSINPRGRCNVRTIAFRQAAVSRFSIASIVPLSMATVTD